MSVSSLNDGFFLLHTDTANNSGKVRHTDIRTHTYIHLHTHTHIHTQRKRKRERERQREREGVGQ